MKALAHLELMVLALGIQHLGGPLRFYDLPDAEASAALAYTIVASHHPELLPGPLTHNGLISIWNAANTRPTKHSTYDDYLR